MLGLFASLAATLEEISKVAIEHSGGVSTLATCACEPNGNKYVRNTCPMVLTQSSYGYVYVVRISKGLYTCMPNRSIDVSSISYHPS